MDRKTTFFFFVLPIEFFKIKILYKEGDDDNNLDDLSKSNCLTLMVISAYFHAVRVFIWKWKEIKTTFHIREGSQTDMNNDLLYYMVFNT